MTLRYKNTYTGLLAAVLLILFAAGCTRNNGNIGSLFGTWHLSSLEIDGEAAPDYEDNCFWLFQNNIISFVTLDDPEDHTALRRWGTFEREGGNLILDLSHHGAGNNDYLYYPPAFLHLPREKSVCLKIVSDNGSRMVLTYTAAGGEVMTYTLIKQ